MMGKEKPIWRLAFFSRLEERKGIKLFVDAVSALNVTDEKFEVHSLAPSRLPYMHEEKAAKTFCCLAMGTVGLEAQTDMQLEMQLFTAEVDGLS
jgi:hypothetical protein